MKHWQTTGEFLDVEQTQAEAPLQFGIVSDDQSLFNKLKSLRTNHVFIRLALSLSGLYFVVSGIQYWMPDYLRHILESSEEAIAWYFTAISITGPVSGVIVGGIITQYLGGYNDVRAQKVLMYAGLGAVAVSIPAPFMHHIEVFCILIWLLLFLGGFILPPLTGIMLNSVDEAHKASANSIANLTYNLFGYMPAPIFYGFVSSITGGEKSRWSMGCLLYSTLVTMVLLVPALSGLIRKSEVQKHLGAS